MIRVMMITTGCMLLLAANGVCLELKPEETKAGAESLVPESDKSPEALRARFSAIQKRMAQAVTQAKTSGETGQAGVGVEGYQVNQGDTVILIHPPGAGQYAVSAEVKEVKGDEAAVVYWVWGTMQSRTLPIDSIAVRRGCVNAAGISACVGEDVLNAAMSPVHVAGMYKNGDLLVVTPPAFLGRDYLRLSLENLGITHGCLLGRDLCVNDRAKYAGADSYKVDYKIFAIYSSGDAAIGLERTPTLRVSGRRLMHRGAMEHGSEIK